MSKVGNSLRVTIPKPVVEGLGLKKGDMLILSVTDGEIKFHKARRDES